MSFLDSENLDAFFRDFRHAAQHYPIRADAVVAYLNAGGEAPDPFISYLRRSSRLVGAGSNDRAVHDYELKVKTSDVTSRGMEKGHGIVVGKATMVDGELEISEPELYVLRRTPEDNTGLSTLSLSKVRST